MNPFAFTRQPGQGLAFEHVGNPLSLEIRRVTDCWACHAAFVIEAPDKLIEAHDLHGVRKTTLADYLNDPTYVRIQVRSAPGLNVEKAVAKALTFDGKPYGTAELFEILLYEKAHIHSIPWEKLDGEGHLICSEVCGRAWLDGEFDVRPGFNIPTIGLYTPAMIVRSVKLVTEYDWRTA